MSSKMLCLKCTVQKYISSKYEGQKLVKNLWDMGVTNREGEKDWESTGIEKTPLYEQNNGEKIVIAWKGLSFS